MIYKVFSLAGRLFGCLSILFDSLGDACFRVEEWAITRARFHKHTCAAVARPNLRRY
jgi:hypothetical protein